MELVNSSGDFTLKGFASKPSVPPKADYVERNMSMRKKMIFILGIILVFLFVGITAFNKDLKIVTYDLKNPKINNQIKLALVTDLHSCYYGENQSELFNEIDNYKPDIVLLVGDIIDDVLDDKNARVFIEELTDKYTSYYVSGNHEWWSGKMYKHFEYLTSAGVKVLRGESDLIEIGNSTVNVCGIDDPEVNRYDTGYICWEDQLDKVGKSLDEDSVNILLSHRPELIDSYIKYGFDIILSGHAHGGQFRIPFVLNGFYAPNQGFFPEYAGGIYDFDDKKLIISRGLSDENSSLPRIYNQPELVFVNIDPIDD